MNKIKVRFDGKIYEVLEAVEPILLLEKEYGDLSKIPETFEAELKYFYFLLKGCNDDFNYSFERFLKLLPFQKGLIEDLQGFANKKKVTEIKGKKRMRRLGCGFLILLVAFWYLAWRLIF